MWSIVWTLKQCILLFLFSEILCNSPEIQSIMVPLWINISFSWHIILLEATDVIAGLPQLVLIKVQHLIPCLGQRETAFLVTRHRPVVITCHLYLYEYMNRTSLLMQTACCRKSVFCYRTRGSLVFAFSNWNWIKRDFHVDGVQYNKLGDILKPLLIYFPINTGFHFWISKHDCLAQIRWH